MEGERGGYHKSVLVATGGGESDGKESEWVSSGAWCGGSSAVAGAANAVGTGIAMWTRGWRDELGLLDVAAVLASREAQTIGRGAQLLFFS